MSRPALLLLLCYFSFAFPLDAQTVDSTVLQIGLRFGPTFEEVRFTPNPTVVNTVRGGEAGLVIRYFDHHLVGFQGEVNYVRAGWEELIPDFAQPYRRETAYVEAQLLTQLSFGRRAIQPLLQVGPYLSAPVADAETLPTGFAADPVTTYYGRMLDFRLNYGLRTGLGVNVNLGPVTVQLEGRYRIGFSDVIRSGSSQAAISQRQGFGGSLSVLYTP